MSNKVTALNREISVRSHDLYSSDPVKAEKARTDIELLKKKLESAKAEINFVIKPSKKSYSIEALRMRELGGISID